jgi:hypothetical protein
MYFFIVAIVSMVTTSDARIAASNNSRLDNKWPNWNNFNPNDNRNCYEREFYILSHAKPFKMLD